MFTEIHMLKTISHKLYTRATRLTPAFVAIALTSAATSVAAAPGDLDPSFNGSGYVHEFGPGEGTSGASLVAVAKNRIVTAYVSSSSSSGTFTSKTYLTRYEAGGPVDTSFGPSGTGIVELPIPDLFCTPVVVEDYAARLIVSSCDDQNMFVWRFDANGIIDTSFGTSGLATIPVGVVSFPITGLTTIKDYILVSLGTHTLSNPTQLFTAIRLDASGALDTSLGGTGIVRHSLQGGAATERSLATDVKFSRKSIILGGRTRSNAALPWNYALARLDWSGALDPSFNGVGHTNFALATGSNRGRKIAIDSKNRIVIAGTAGLVAVPPAAGGSAVGVARVLPNGALDTSFMGTGIGVYGGGSPATGGFCSNLTYGFDITLSADRPILTGYCDQYLSGPTGSPDPIAYILRLNVNGAYDTTFGTTLNGYSYFNFGFPNSQLTAVRLDTSGQIIAAGGAYKTDGVDFYGAGVTARITQ
jgi:uncharacterized delta-60 repeat protein